MRRSSASRWYTSALSALLAPPLATLAKIPSADGASDPMHVADFQAVVHRNALDVPSSFTDAVALDNFKLPKVGRRQADHDGIPSAEGSFILRWLRVRSALAQDLDESVGRERQQRAVARAGTNTRMTWTGWIGLGHTRAPVPGPRRDGVPHLGASSLR